MTINSPLNSPVRSNRRNSWEASLEQNGREPRLKTESGSRSRNASPARSVGESDEDDDADFSGFTFDDNDNDSNSGSEEAGTQEGKGTWTREEHKRFLEAIKIYANGPWKLVAEYVGTRTVRQTMTHAQKYRQKAARRIRGLRTKQAIMRMHIGHEVSEESMLQERIRTALGETRGVGGGYLPPELATFIRSPVGSPVMPSSPVLQAAMNMPTSPVGYHSPMMPGSPIGNQMMYPNNTVQLQPPPVEQFAPISLPPLSLDMPLSITVRAPTAMDGGMPVYAAATPPPSHPGSPAISPVSSLTSRMNALAPNFGYDDEPELEIIEDLTNSPTLQECANELMDVLFDGNQTEDANQVQPVLVEPASMSLATDLGDLDFDI